MKNKVTSALKIAIGWPLSLIAIFFIFKLLIPQIPELIIHLKSADTAKLISSICCFIIFYFLRSYIWFLLMQRKSHTLRFSSSSFLWATSELKRYVPGNIWSFLGRTVLFSERGIAKKEIAKSLIIEAELYIIGCFIVSLLALPFLSHYLFPHSRLLQYSVPLLIAAGVFFYLFNGKFIKYIPHALAKIFSVILPDQDVYEIALLLTISCISLIFFGLGYYFSIDAIFPFTANIVVQMIGFFVFSFVVGYLTFLTPAGFGAREGLVIFGLSQFMNLSLAAFAALFSRIVLVISEVIFILLTYLLSHVLSNKKL